MLNLTSRGKAHTCDGSTRRDFLQVGALGAIGLGLPQYLTAAEHGAVDPSKDKRSCIMIFNLGAPSQLDTFDMKPNAPAEVRGPFKAISTKGDFQLSEILPKHAEIADKFSIVRSCYHTAAAVHDAGWQMLQTGRQFTGGVNYPMLAPCFNTCEVDERIFLLTLYCQKRWVVVAVIYPTASRAASWAKPSIRLP